MTATNVLTLIASEATILQTLIAFEEWWSKRHTTHTSSVGSAKRRAYRCCHRLRLSFPSCLPYFPGTELGEGRGTGDEVVEVGVPEPGLPVGVGLPCNPGTFSTTIVI